MTYVIVCFTEDSNPNKSHNEAKLLITSLKYSQIKPYKVIVLYNYIPVAIEDKAILQIKVDEHDINKVVLQLFKWVDEKDFVYLGLSTIVLEDFNSLDYDNNFSCKYWVISSENSLWYRKYTMTKIKKILQIPLVNDWYHICSQGFQIKLDNNIFDLLNLCLNMYDKDILKFNNKEQDAYLPYLTAGLNIMLSQNKISIEYMRGSSDFSQFKNDPLLTSAYNNVLNKNFIKYYQYNNIDDYTLIHKNNIKNILIVRKNTYTKTSNRENVRVLLITDKRYSIYTSTLITLLNYFDPDIPITVIAEENTTLLGKVDELIVVKQKSLTGRINAYKFKLTIPDYMNNKDNYIYLDSDILINKSIRSLFDWVIYHPITICYSCWCVEAEKKYYTEHEITYINTGCMIFPKEKLKNIFSFAREVYDRRVFPDLYGDEFYIAYALKKHNIEPGYTKDIGYYKNAETYKSDIGTHYPGAITHQVYLDHLQYLLNFHNIEFDKNIINKIRIAINNNKREDYAMP